MNDNDLRDCFAMFALCGIISREGCYNLATAEHVWMMADCMMETRTPKDVGIKTVKRTRKTND